MLRRFGVGMAPSAWDQVLTSAASGPGSRSRSCGRAGLIQKGRQGGHYDRFRSRIMFPIRDQRGRVLGFGARALSADSKPKYLNSPEGELYRKSETLYGIDRARGAIAKARRAIVVEGYTDVLALHQAGIEEAVAIMGTAITPEQLTALSGPDRRWWCWRWTPTAPGADAMIRAQRVAGGEGLDLRVAAMPEDEDPADMLQEGRARSLPGAGRGGDRPAELPGADRARRAATWEASPAASGALAEVAPVLAAMGEVVGRDELIREVADRLDTDPSLVSERVRSAPQESSGGCARAAGNGANGLAGAAARGADAARDCASARCWRCASPTRRRAGASSSGSRDEHLSAAGWPGAALAARATSTIRWRASRATTRSWSR